MAPREPSPHVQDAGAPGAPAMASPFHEAPETYHRLLDEYAQLLGTLDFNPYAPPVQLLRWSLHPWRQRHFWTTPHVSDFVKVPDALRQDLPCASAILERVHALDDQHLRALARCSALNASKMTHRVLLGAPNKIFVTLAALLAGAKGLNEAFGLDLGRIAEPVLPLIVAALVGAVVGVVLNLLMFYHRLQMVRALDDIISIAVAARGTDG